MRALTGRSPLAIDICFMETNAVSSQKRAQLLGECSVTVVLLLV